MSAVRIEDTLRRHPFVDLAASGPDAERGADLEMFGQFVGSWDVHMVWMPVDKPGERYNAEWHFGWVLEGRAIQDVLITHRQNGELIGYGSTVRTFDPRRGVWWIVWQDPVAGEFAVLLARKENADIVLEGQWSIGAPDGRFKWTFHHIARGSFEWSCPVAVDGDAEWQHVEEMKATRRS